MSARDSTGDIAAMHAVARLKGPLVLVFKAAGPVRSMASVHAVDCPVVLQAVRKGASTSTEEDEPLSDAIADLEARGFPVTHHPCCSR